MRFLVGSCAIVPILVSREKRVRSTSTIVSRSLANTAVLVSMGSRSVDKHRNIVDLIPIIHSKIGILPTNLAAVVCVGVCVDVCQCAKFDKFLPARSHFESKRPENFVRIAKFPYAAFGPLFAFLCTLFFTRNNDLE